MYSKAINALVFVAIAAYQMGIECRVNLAYGKNAAQSSTLLYNGYRWDARMALDNVTTFTNYSCQCCSITSIRIPKWWRVDLGQQYDIGKIEIFGRPSSYESRGLRVFVSIEIGDFTGLGDFPQLVYTGAYRENANNRDSHYIINLTNPRRGRFITITKHTLDFMIVCEVLVYESCQDYQFEPNCETCNCADTPCNKSTGICSQRCQPGWAGDSCNIYEL